MLYLFTKIKNTDQIKLIKKADLSWVINTETTIKHK